MKRVVFLFKSRQVAHCCLSGTHTTAQFESKAVALLVDYRTN